MKVSGIDKEFIDIIHYLNKNHYKPFASCDRVLASHDDPESVTLAYIAFLNNTKTEHLMATLLRDSMF